MTTSLRAADGAPTETFGNPMPNEKERGGGQNLLGLVSDVVCNCANARRLTRLAQNLTKLTIVLFATTCWRLRGGVGGRCYLETRKEKKIHTNMTPLRLNHILNAALNWLTSV